MGLVCTYSQLISVGWAKNKDWNIYLNSCQPPVDEVLWGGEGLSHCDLYQKYKPSPGIQRKLPEGWEKLLSPNSMEIPDGREAS